MLPPQKTEFLSMSNSCFLAEKESFTHAEKCSSPLLQAVSSPIGKTKIHFFLKKKEWGQQTDIHTAGLVVPSKHRTTILFSF